MNVVVNIAWFTMLANNGRESGQDKRRSDTNYTRICFGVARERTTPWIIS